MAKLNGNILIVDDERPMGEFLSTLMQRQGLTTNVVLDGQTALNIISASPPDVLFVDMKMPGLDGLEVLKRARTADQDLPVILVTGYAEVRGAVEAMKAGAHDYISKPFNHDEVVRVVTRALGERTLKNKVKYLSGRLQNASLRETMGTSEAISALISDATRVAKSDFSVVILGETGSGKEVVARAIHHASPRSKNPFIPVDCGAIPETLLESELFGYEKGSFTGALTQRSGKFEAAAGGTLFLDEISNMPGPAQAKLLRVLQEKTIYHLGSSKPVSIDVRVLAASNVDLQSLVEAGTFRRDLFFRLTEFNVNIPPLRERREDILYLAKRFMDITNIELNKSVTEFSRSAIEALITYNWPGNVRQLRSAIRRAVLLADDIITGDHLDLIDAGGLPRRAKSNTGWNGLPMREIMRRNAIAVEREILTEVLRKTGGNKAKAARLLQIDYKTIHSKVKQYGIEIDGTEDYRRDS
jgi:DNA-binding NtrC family response regulator